MCVSAPKGRGEAGRDADEGAIVVAQKDEESHASTIRPENWEWSNSYIDKKQELAV